jgi:hypothetical protein
VRRPIESPDLPEELRSRLVALLAEDTARLAGLTGLDLGHWSTARVNPGAPALAD